MGRTLFLLIFILPGIYSAQKTYFGDEPIIWGTNTRPEIPDAYQNYLNSDLVILDDHAQFYFYARDNERLGRNILIKINNEAGLEKIQNLKLPESFDPAFDANLFKQGRRARIKTPFIREFTVSKLAARKFSKGKWTDVPLKHTYETIRWIKFTGEFMNEDISIFRFFDLAVGDVLEIYYESVFMSDYGSNLFYFHSAYPKLKCKYDFTYKINKRNLGYEFLLSINIKDSLVHKAILEQKEDVIRTDEIKLKNLAPINYGTNSFEGKKLPHVFADFYFYRVLAGSYPVDGSRLYEIELVRPKNFEWLLITDTTNYYTRIYDKQFSGLRKFVATLPPMGSDSSNKVFFKALCDTFNHYRFISSNHLFYNESNLYNLYSADHLLKRRIVEHSMWKVYRDILNDNKIFYFNANIIDKRYAEHSPFKRCHYAYENNLIAIPNKDSYIYFMPRYQGIKYHLNELPFYLEGSLAALSPQNFQGDIKNKEKKFFKFIKTHYGTFNENTRTENATVKISLDSLKADVFTKESLSGQFSTILRHLYLNEYIDSTISPAYFKRCSDKPRYTESKIKLSSFVSDFPFRYTFNCTGKISLQTSKRFDISNWFSFFISTQTFPELPTHDYYFDFDYSDSYNFLLDFNSIVDIKNTAAFKKTIHNNYFELESDIVKNSETAYLVKVRLAVKERMIPLDKKELIAELLEALEFLNHFSLDLGKN
jgi:hypothetical protein